MQSIDSYSICSHDNLSRVKEHDSNIGFVYRCKQCQECCSFTNFARSSADERFYQTESSKGSNNNKKTDSMISRLQDDFESSLGWLGEGSFGAVAKFKNKRDGKIYAIKKTQATEKNEREVRVLSTLQHRNIVRYFSSWSESNDSAFPKRPVKLIPDNFLSDERETDHSREEKIEAVLYIQMECCEKKTLREVINSGSFLRDEYRMWKIFRQIVEGISYFHAMKVIHRDLKPENIFLDLNDCAKIGDFGLASSATLRRRQLINSAASSSRGSVTSGSVYGTPLFRAPEIDSGTYCNKVDIYSLGVIFYEMCYGPFETESEWINELEKIRRPGFKLPLNSVKSYETVKQIKVRQFTKKPKIVNPTISAKPKPTNDMIVIINQLLENDPKKRPTAKELLSSSNMPPPLLDRIPEILHLIKFILFRGEGSEYHSLMTLCHGQAATEKIMVEWLGRGIGTRHQLQSYFSLNMSTSSKFIKRCQESGANYFQSTALLPRVSLKGDYTFDALNDLATILDQNASPNSFMDKSGNILVLPSNSHTSFANDVARYNIDNLKRYAVNQVDATKLATSSEPWTEFVYDIVTSSNSAKGLRKDDAEVVQIITQVIGDCKLSSVQLHMGHRSLTEAIFIYCQLSVDQIATLTRNIQATLRDPFMVSKPNIEGLSDSCVELFWELNNVRGTSLSEVKSRFTSLISLTNWIGSAAAALADKAFNELEEIENNLSKSEDLNQKGLPMLFDVSVGLESFNIYSAFSFKIIYEPEGDEDMASVGSSKKEKKSTVLASGGRYDSLVASYRDVIDNHPALIKICSGSNNQGSGQHISGGSINLNSFF